MALKFYLFEKNLQHEIHCNTNSTITEIAGTFDLGTMELEWNECEHAIFPNTPFFIEETETNEIWNFIICEDNVEVIKKTNTIKYLHKITLSQSIHKLNNVALRNTVFTQPSDSIKRYTRSIPFVRNVKYQYGQEFSQDKLLKIASFSSTFLKENYSFLLSGKVEKADILIETAFEVAQDCVVGESTIMTMSYAKYHNSHFTYRIPLYFYDSDNPSQYITWFINASAIGYKTKIPNNVLEWMSNHRKFYVDIPTNTVEVGNITTPIPSMVSASPSDPTIYSIPMAYGLIKVTIDVETYEYSLYDILDILNKQCKKTFNGIDSFSNFYLLPSTDNTNIEIAEHAETLINTPAPEFTFTNIDLYQAVAKTLSYIDAFPVLTKDGILDFQYLNDLSKEKIDSLQINDIKTTLNEENYTNRLGNIYQNGRLSNPITYPQKNMFIRPATSNYGIPDKNDWYWYVSKPIDYIRNIKVLCPQTKINILPEFSITWTFYENYTVTKNVTVNDSELSIYNTPRICLDITKFVYPKETYDLLEINYGNRTKANTKNSLYYTRNDNKIYLGLTDENETDISGHKTDDVLRWVLRRALLDQYGYGNEHIQDTLISETYFSFDYSGNKNDYFFCCEYFPILDGKVAEESVVNKTEKETLVSQDSGNMQLERLGNNLQGLIAKLGNEQKAITLPITEFKNKIKLGSYFDDQYGNHWIANKIQTTFTTSEEKVIVNATFTKNFNALAQFTSLNQEKRMYEISNSIINKGYETYNEFIYFTTQILTLEQLSNLSNEIALYPIAVNTILFSIISNSEANYNRKCESVVLKTNNISTFVVPTVYGFGNQICFEISFDESTKANNRYYNGETKPWLYTQQNGIANDFEIECKFTPLDYFDDPYKYPEAEVGTVFTGETAFLLDHIQYYKKPNEILHINYSICFLPYWVKNNVILYNDITVPQYTYEDIFFGDVFVNKNAIIPNLSSVIKKYELWLSNEKYSILDIKAKGVRYEPIAPEIIVVNDSYVKAATITAQYGKIEVWDTFAIDVRINVSQYKSWCIADEDGNICIAVNRNKNSSEYAELRWFTSRFRKV